MKTELELRMPAGGARAVSLIRAVDEVDRLGELVPISERQQRTQAAFDGVDLPALQSAKALDGVTADGAALDGKTARRLTPPLIERARGLAVDLVRRHPELRPLLEPAGGAGVTAGLVIAALAFGAASNVLGPAKAVSVLAPPLLGLILWNLAIFAFLGLNGLRRLVAGPGEAGAVTGRFEGLVRRWTRRPAVEETSTAARVASQHSRAWFRASLPLESARWSARFHLGAAAMVAAAVAGMYARGLAFEYRATWESTFLSAETVDAILRAVLAPATALLGLALPGVDTLRAPASGPAAPWIHAWAVSAALFVIAPRVLLAARALLETVRLERRLPLQLPPTYLRRVLAAASTAPHEAQVIPYSYRPVERSMEVLRRVLLDVLGARANLRINPTVAYGEAPQASSAAWRILLFNLAQTPEVEVHGEVLQHLAGELADGQRLLVVVDEAPLLARVPEAQRAERRESRRRAWIRNLNPSPAAGDETSPPQPVFLAVDDDLDADHALDALTRGAWPPAATGGKRG
ncbi:MAG: DUF2868 domain-containing protein [Acidobacteriota bacterium]